MDRYISANIDRICPRGHKHWDVLELTGPYGLGRVLSAHMQRTPASRIAMVPRPLPFATTLSAGSWTHKAKHAAVAG